MKDCKQLRKVQIPTDQDSIDMISQPDCWPRMVLPLMRNGEPGVIINEHAYHGDFTVKFCNMLLLPHTLAEYEALDGIKYDAPEEVILDGWVVD